MATVIIGGGIVGLSVAYYLALLRPQDCEDHLIHVVDNAPHLFLSASGYAGGLICKDWFSPAASSLGEVSFRLHKELADQHDGSKHWGYAPSISYSMGIETTGVGGTTRSSGKDWLLEGNSRSSVASTSDKPKAESNAGGGERNEMLNEDGTPAWITKQEGGTLEEIGSEDGCAQIEPRDLCVWLLKECQRHGIKVHLNCTATKLEKDDDNNVVGVKVRKDFEIYEKKCKNIVITAGAWTPRVFKQLFPSSKTQIPIDPLAGYAIVLRSPRFTRPIVDPRKHGQSAVNGECHSVFCGPSSKWKIAPEAISRIPHSGKPEIYVGGVNSSTLQLPDRADKVKDLMDEEKMKELKDVAVMLTGLSKEGDELVQDDLQVVRESLCFRPVSATGTPIVSKMTDLGEGVHMPTDGGVYVASGHGPWGISLSLGTGLTIAEMMLGKTTTADVSALALN